MARIGGNSRGRFYPKYESRYEDAAYCTWMCLICGYVFDEAAGSPEEGIPAGTRWRDIPINWVCPECGARKDEFEMLEI